MGKRYKRFKSGVLAGEGERVSTFLLPGMAVDATRLSETGKRFPQSSASMRVSELEPPRPCGEMGCARPITRGTRNRLYVYVKRPRPGQSSQACFSACE